jgi:hypothetical protein
MRLLAIFPGTSSFYPSVAVASIRYVLLCSPHKIIRYASSSKKRAPAIFLVFVYRRKTMQIEVIFEDDDEKSRQVLFVLSRSVG